jgi:integrase
VPVFGRLRLDQLERGTIKRFLAGKLNEGLTRNSVRIIHATLRGMLNHAIDDGLIDRNPALGLGRQLKLVASPETRQETIKAFDRSELFIFLNTALKIERRWYPLFLTLARAGMRLGEALALRWEDVDFEQRVIRIARNLSKGALGTPKSGHGRDVDMSEQLAATLRQLSVIRKKQTLKRAWRQVPPWVFCSVSGGVLDEANVRRAFRRVLKSAGFPFHYTPHCLRHTYASLLLQQGESPE